MQQRETAAIPKLVLGTGERVLRRIAIDRPRLTIGRRPYSDLMLDDLTVSGEHAVLVTAHGETTIHDLDSRNGTLVNGEPVTQRTLVDGDRIEIGVYRLHYVVERAPGEGAAHPDADPAAVAHVLTLAGARAGTTVRLDRPIVSLAGGAGQVAVIARRRGGYVVTHLEGPAYPLVNGESIGLVARPLGQGDLIELAGTIFRFHADPPP